MKMIDFIDGEVGGCRNLFEMRIMTPQGPLTVLRNPPMAVLTDLITGSKWHNVRGLLVGRDLYFWDAMFATHHDIARHLNVVDHEDMHLVLYGNEGKYHADLPAIADLKQVARRITPLLKNSAFTFTVLDDLRDEIEGNEIALQLAA